jgi:hypothetical protein
MEPVIGKETRKAIVNSIAQLFQEYSEKINDAYMNAEGPMSVAFKVKMTPAADGRVDVVSGISFVAEKCQDEVRFQCDENQLKLFNFVHEDTP